MTPHWSDPCRLHPSHQPIGYSASVAAPLDPKLKALIDGVKAKRPRTVLDHILRHGFVSTEDLKELYGYNHPPRAARDVREHGIPLETFSVQGKDGRTMAAYRFADPALIEAHKLGGRQVFPKELAEALFLKQHGRCALTGLAFEQRYLQVDHRVPYEVAGDDVAEVNNPDAFMLVSGTANRRKSWSCENCPNWQEQKDPNICLRCYWASPENYDHIATRQVRQITLSWEGEEIHEYERLAADAEKAGKPLADYLKDLL